MAVLARLRVCVGLYDALACGWPAGGGVNQLGYGHGFQGNAQWPALPYLSPLSLSRSQLPDHRRMYMNGGLQ